jgi:hypothetical protein
LTLVVAWSVPLLRAAPSFGAGRTSSGADPVIPRETKVLLLPPIDATVDAAVLAPLRRQFIRLPEEYEFIRRQFVVLGDEMAARAAAVRPSVDLRAGAAGRSAETLDELARRTDADWVVSILVREIKTDPFNGAGFKVHSSLRVQIWDARRHAWLANGPYVGRLVGGGAPGRLFIDSLRAATEEALQRVLAAYPPIVPVSRDGSIVDYLAGQRVPFVGDAYVTFRGLRGLPADQP